MNRSKLIGPFIALTPPLILLVLVGLITGWQFVYTLDDPYIHLALAKGINSFHYGINPPSTRPHRAAFCGHSLWHRLPA